MSLVDELRAARWFGGKSRLIRDVSVVERARWVDAASMCLVDVQYADPGGRETYVMAERLDDPDVALALLDQFKGTTIRTEAGGVLTFRPTPLLRAVPEAVAEPVGLLRGEQSNTSIRYGDTFILKLLRRVQFGPNPDVEVGRYLAEHTSFRGTPAVLGSLDYTRPDGADASLALLQRFVPNRGDVWTTTLQRLHHVLAGADMRPGLDAMARLGRITAELHLALAQGAGDFSAEPIEAGDVAGWRAAIDVEVGAATQALASRAIELDSGALLRRADGIGALEGALKTRHHGDYHLGQVLERDDGSFVIIDFEGEPSRSLAQRRAKHSPLRDVAGMLRSFDYARHAALRAGDPLHPQRIRTASAWYAAVRQAFLTSYLGWVRANHPRLLPTDVPASLAALELEKAVYEVLYELNNRPEWLAIPLTAMISV